MKSITEKVKQIIFPFVKNMEGFTENQLNIFFHHYFSTFETEYNRKEIAREFLKNYKSYIQYMIDNFEENTTMVLN